MEFSGADLSV